MWHLIMFFYCCQSSDSFQLSSIFWQKLDYHFEFKRFTITISDYYLRENANDTDFLLTFSGHRFINILSELSRLEPHYLITTSMWNFVELTLKYLVLNSLLSFSLKLLRSIICINFTKRFNFDVTGNSSMIQVKICTK